MLAIGRICAHFWVSLVLAPLIVGAFGVVPEKLLLKRICHLDHLYDDRGLELGGSERTEPDRQSAEKYRSHMRTDSGPQTDRQTKLEPAIAKRDK
jgi:hypothetical protein